MSSVLGYHSTLTLSFGGFTVDHPNTVVYPEDFWYEVHKIMALSEKQWKSFDRIRIRNQQRRITKGCFMY